MQRILIKAAPGLSETKLTFGAASEPFKVEPLYRSIGAQGGLGAAAADVWYVATPPAGAAGQNPWDLCHSLVKGSGVAGKPTFAEPDLEQSWIPPGNGQGGMALAQTCDKPAGQKPEYPVNGNNYWFRDATHSQFDAALAAIGGPDIASKVRIAHFDTGYDPHHHALPKRLRRDGVQRNFVDPDYPSDASDRTAAGILTNLGHGTGTLSILAGAPLPPATSLGAAPFAEVIPIRVANSVVLFTNSSIAKAFDYVHSLNVEGKDRVDIITMSMGGLASQAWADAVNALYEQGVFIVTAAGNNYGNLPTRNIVYPARFNRVLAACGVMADGKPYADLAFQLMAGNYGPIAKMATALAAATPNVPWARLGCPDIVDFNGSGTSAATPQVAAAAAIWLQRNRAAVDAYPESWMRVEAIRKALFESAALDGAHRNATGIDLHLGQGRLQANGALAKAPALAATLSKTAVDTVGFPIQQVLTGLGMQGEPDSPRQRMLELEALQLSQNAAIDSLIPESPDMALQADWRRLGEALAAHPNASKELREALSVRTGAIAISQPANPAPLGNNSVLNIQLAHAKRPRPPIPAVRPLRVYAYDPSLGARLDTLGINQATLEVRWEDDLKPGPIGEYIEVVDVDPASQCCYAPVDLNDSYLLTRSGLTPSEASPQFHQQMVYAVSMKTIEHFEKALGRVALWAPREVVQPQKPKLAAAGPTQTTSAAPAPAADDVCADTEPVKELEYVQRLRIYPHALRAKNAYYSPEHKALLLGYFRSDTTVEGLLPGNVVFTAVSHDVVAHETTHGLLDGVHRRFREPTNPDVLAFHEAFADIVALFQHFTLPEALKHQIAATRGDLEKQNLLGQLALQFGMATGRYGALRDYITDIKKTSEEGAGQKAGGAGTPGDVNARPSDGEKAADGSKASEQPAPGPTKTDYELAGETGDPHAVGAVLVAAVFDAFLQIYKVRKADLIRLATDGTGVLPQGDISIDLVNRLAREASKVAGQMLNICIRALDYCPPVDIMFGEYLRALITADFDLVPYDRLGYRIAFVEAFRKRGIYPRDVKHLSPGSLVWEAPPLPLRQGNVKKIIEQMSTSWDLRSGRREAYELSRKNACAFHKWLMEEVEPDELAALGLIRIQKPQPYKIGDHEGCLHGIEVHSVRPVRRVSPDGNVLADLVVEITQSFRPKGMPGVRFRGGCTLIIDLGSGDVRYMVRKKVDSLWRFNNQMKFAEDSSFGLQGNYFADPSGAREPFAMVHHVHG